MASKVDLEKRRLMYTSWFIFEERCCVTVVCWVDYAVSSTPNVFAKKMMQFLLDGNVENGLVKVFANAIEVSYFVFHRIFSGVSLRVTFDFVRFADEHCGHRGILRREIRSSLSVGPADHCRSAVVQRHEEDNRRQAADSTQDEKCCSERTCCFWQNKRRWFGLGSWQ